MPKIKSGKIFSDPVLTEITYSVLRSIENKDKVRLKGRHLMAAKNESTAKFFATNSSLEDKLLLFSAMGMTYFLVIANSPALTIRNLSEILDKYKTDDKLSTIREFAKLNIYISSNKQFLHLLGLMEQSINHPSYILNLEYNRIGYHLKKWSTSAKSVYDMPIRESIQNADLIVKTMLNSVLTLESSQGIFGISPLEMKILLYLYPFRNIYVSIDKLWNYFLADMGKNRVSNNIKRLMEAQYVQKSALSEDREYTITGLGISVVNSFVQKVFNANNF